MAKIDGELQVALDLISKLSNALSQADTASGAVNQRLLQTAHDFLEKFGANAPTFEER
jgi:hypothetical protein